MVFIRKRFYIWLVKAYLKRLSKIIIISVVAGMVFSVLILFIVNTYLLPKFQKKTQKIGISGIYTVQVLPAEIAEQVSFGLTQITEDGKIKSGAADRWEIKDKGKTYIFHLKKNLYYHNGENLNSENLEINFKDAKRKNLDKYTVSFTLKDSYSPFLVSVSKPIFTKKLSGLGKYKISKIDLNAGFLRTIIIENVSDKSLKKIYYFYPTNEALRIAFSLGEVNKITGISKFFIKDTDISTWKNVKLKKYSDYNRLMTVFYNNDNKNLSDKKLRQALNYSLPKDFDEGERAFSSINPKSIFYEKNDTYSIQDLEIAKSLLESSEVDKKTLVIKISTLKEHEKVARKIQNYWNKIGIKTTIETIEDIPKDFDVLLYAFKLPKDPDQYTLWHYQQPNNISNYNNKRIDKLLEDGRKTNNVEERIIIYRDFQKYLLVDVPASFLYFPYDYEIERAFVM